MNREGITTAHDAWSEFDPNYYEAFDELAKDDKLTVRYRGSWFVDPNGDFADDIVYGVGLSRRFTHPHFKIHSFKFLADNILEEETNTKRDARPSLAHVQLISQPRCDANG